MPMFRFDGAQLVDWASFHRVFAQSLGFPAYYGKNMDAWIDCMSSPDDWTPPVPPASGVIVIHIDNAASVPADIFKELVECAGFVNWRDVEAGSTPRLVLSFYR